MKNILIIGAGKSSSSLITYLLDNSFQEDLQITIADILIENALKLINHHSRGQAIVLDIFDKKKRQEEIEKTDLVISMLPPNLHFEIAKDCILLKKHLVTASYISEEMKTLNEDAIKNGLVFMNEIGLDPGIDHMSAMKLIDRIKNNGGKILLFESFCGGLVAPESDTNLWNYKFTWNPRNVVLAGQGGAAKFIQEGTYKYIPYHKLFRRTEFLEVEGFGRFEAYANRDSLKYREVYGLQNAETCYRGTIRRVGFSKAWDVFVQLGMTDDTYIIDDSEHMSNRDFVNLFLPYHPTDSIEIKFRHQLKIDQDDVIWDKLMELDLFSKSLVPGLKNATPAQMLEKILSYKWTLQPEDKDMIVMYHKIGYELNGEQKQIDATMVCLGDDQTYTAMAKTVGLPVAIAALKILNGEIQTTGMQLPIAKEVYLPILAELEKYGVVFNEFDVPYFGYDYYN